LRPSQYKEYNANYRKSQSDFYVTTTFADRLIIASLFRTKDRSKDPIKPNGGESNKKLVSDPILQRETSVLCGRLNELRL